MLSSDWMTPLSDVAGEHRPGRSPSCGSARRCPGDVHRHAIAVPCAAEAAAIVTIAGVT